MSSHSYLNKRGLTELATLVTLLDSLENALGWRQMFVKNILDPLPVSLPPELQARTRKRSHIPARQLGPQHRAHSHDESARQETQVTRPMPCGFAHALLQVYVRDYVPDYSNKCECRAAW